MNAQLIFIVSSIACLTLSHVVLTEKYPFIGDCKGDQHSDGCFRHLTFICDRAKVVHNDCFSDANLSYCITLNISENALTELSNFTSESIPNVMISGIDNNQINCTHFKEIFAKLTSQRLDSYTTLEICDLSDENSDESEYIEEQFTEQNTEKYIKIVTETSTEVDDQRPTTNEPEFLEFFFRNS